MKRFVLILLALMLVFCNGYAAEEYSYDKKTKIFEFHDFLFDIPVDFDCYMIRSKIPIFYPERLDAQTSLIFISEKAESVTELDLLNSMSSMKETLMAKYNLSVCNYEKIVNFANTKALLYSFSSEKHSECYSAVTLNEERNELIVITQITDDTDSSGLDYENDFLMLLSSGKKTTTGSPVESTIRERVSTNSYYTNTVIDRITINKNLGTSDPDDYIVLIYLKWETKNNVKNTKKMLEMLSDDMAAVLAEKYNDASEITLFWEVPYQLANGVCAKYSYECKNGGAYQTEKFGPLYH